MDTPCRQEKLEDYPITYGFFQTEVSNPENDTDWHDITRRETIEGAEAAINGSVEHFENKLEATKGPKVVKTFE